MGLIFCIKCVVIYFEGVRFRVWGVNWVRRFFGKFRDVVGDRLLFGL